MSSEELAKLMKQVEEKGMDWETVEKKIKVPHAVLNLYVNSGPVPVTIMKNLTKLVEEPAA